MKATKNPLPFNIVPYNSFARSEGKNISLLNRALQPGVQFLCVSISRFRRNDEKRISAMALANNANSYHGTYFSPSLFSRSLSLCRFF